jgi:hypothetical protein
MNMITCTVDGCVERPATIGVRDFLLTRSAGVHLSPAEVLAIQAELGSATDTLGGGPLSRPAG